MRLHRGSSKDGRGTSSASENLPLSAPPLPMVHVEIEVVRGGHTRRSEVEVPSGTTVRVIVRTAGVTPEGCAVLAGDTPLPLDAPVDRPLRLTIVPTFSGG